MLPADRYGRTVHFICGFVLGALLALPLIGRVVFNSRWPLSVALGGAALVGLLVGWWASRHLDDFWNGIGDWWGER